MERKDYRGGAEARGRILEDKRVRSLEGWTDIST